MRDIVSGTHMFSDGEVAHVAHQLPDYGLECSKFDCATMK